MALHIVDAVEQRHCRARRQFHPFSVPQFLRKGNCETVYRTAAVARLHAASVPKFAAVPDEPILLCGIAVMVVFQSAVMRGVDRGGKRVKNSSEGTSPWISSLPFPSPLSRGDHSAFTSIWVGSFAVTGTVSVSTPFSSFALMSSTEASLGNRNDRSNEP